VIPNTTHASPRAEKSGGFRRYMPKRKRKRIKSHVQGEAVATAKTHPDRVGLFGEDRDIRGLHDAADAAAERDAGAISGPREGETHEQWFERWLAEEWQG